MKDYTCQNPFPRYFRVREVGTTRELFFRFPEKIEDGVKAYWAYSMDRAFSTNPFIFRFGKWKLLEQVYMNE